jgi:hypothetical protein
MFKQAKSINIFGFYDVILESMNNRNTYGVHELYIFNKSYNIECN